MSGFTKAYVDCKNCKGTGCLTEYGAASTGWHNADKPCPECESTGKVEARVTRTQAQALIDADERRYQDLAEDFEENHIWACGRWNKL